MPHLAMLLPRYRFDTIIDEWANVGQFAPSVTALGQQAYVFGRAKPGCLKRLAARVASVKQCLTHECALVQSRGKVMLNLPAATDFSSCLPVNKFGKNRFYDGLKIEGTVEVELRTLAEIVDAMSPATIGCRLLLKLDTQGRDIEVLRGAASPLKLVQVVVTGVLLQAIHRGAPLFPAVIELVKANGFELSGFFPFSRNDDLRIMVADGFSVLHAGLLAPARCASPPS
ncbi:MAG: FkbM family methyltransferase [Aeromicrobium sp.]|nr:FkbM family methyltransferase [Burkholderiales bacterium]